MVLDYNVKNIFWENKAILQSAETFFPQNVSLRLIKWQWIAVGVSTPLKYN